MNTLTFGDAIAALKQGKKVARTEWNGKGMYLWLLPAASVKAEWCKEPHLKTLAELNGGEVECLGSVRMKTADGNVLTGWLASQTDMLSEDWVIVEDVADTIRIEAGVRYPEDGEINDTAEDNDNPKMPFLVPDPDSKGEWRWNLDVNIATGEVIGWPKDVIAHVHYMVCDCCRIKYGDKSYEEYVPDFLSIDDSGYGGYVILTIENGFIKNWNADLCREFIKKCLSND